MYLKIYCKKLGLACNTRHDVYILIGGNADKTEQLAALHLKADIEKVLGLPVYLSSEKENFPTSGQILVIGTLFLAVTSGS